MSRITSPFGIRSTSAEVLDEISLAGRRAVVTGASGGIGAETALALASAGADVTLAVRNVDAGRRVAAAIRRSSGSEQVAVAHLDLADSATIAEFTRAWDGPLHILVANAGLSLPDLRRTSDGVELTFAVCHLGHFALTLGLYEALKSAGGARVVSVSSGANLASPVVFDDISFRFRAYTGMLAYGQAKTANVLFAVGVTDRWANDGILANAATPGIVASTNLSRHRTPEQQKAVQNTFIVPEEMRKSIPEGAATPVFAAASPLLDGIGGRYLEDCNEARILHDQGDGLTGVAAYAVSPANADRLWEESLRLISRWQWTTMKAHGAASA